jgi:hypothetical protein
MPLYMGALDFLTKFGCPYRAQSMDWLPMEAEVDGWFRVGDLRVGQWAVAGLILRLDSGEEAAVLCAPTLYSEGAEGLWLWVSADFPDNSAVLPPKEGVLWTRQTLMQADAASRLLGRGHR